MFSSPPSSQWCGARGLLIPDDIVRNSGLLRSDPATFWSSNQFYIKRDPRQFCEWKPDGESMLKLLSLIPDHHFCLIQSLCLDFGCWSPNGFLCVNPTSDVWFANDNFERLMQNILRRGNKNLVVKLLWNTTMSIPLERMSRWNTTRRKWGYESYEGPFDERCFDIFARFKKRLRSLGYHYLRSSVYDEDRVRLITRVIWKDELPNIIDWVTPQEEEYEECEDIIYEIDSISKEYVWKKLWESVRMSYGLM